MKGGLNEEDRSKNRRLMAMLLLLSVMPAASRGLRERSSRVEGRGHRVDIINQLSFVPAKTSEISSAKWVELRIDTTGVPNGHGSSRSSQIISDSAKFEKSFPAGRCHVLLLGGYLGVSVPSSLAKPKRQNTIAQCRFFSLLDL